MKSKKNPNNKSRAQAMVEFAITLPILLMLMYGILEAGRLLFLYSTVVTASRQAVRYGSATGVNGAGTPRYQDCDGIRASAARAAFLGPFDVITISHDEGVTNANPPVPINPAAYCAGATDPWTPVGNSQRLIVTVQEQFNPIVPKLVPFITRTITATSARTIFVSVPILVTAPAGGGGGGGGVLTLDVFTNPTNVSAPQNVAIGYFVTNTGATDLATPITITPNLASWSCSGEPATLTAGGGNFLCTGIYTVTQADIDAGSDIPITAGANAGGQTAPNDTAIITISQSPSLTLDKSGPISVAAANNTPVTYAYTLINSGNVTLGPPYNVTDDKVANNNITCPSSGTIAPGASINCTGTYSIKNSDITAGSVTNVATATALFGAQTITSNSDTWTVITPPVVLSVSASPASVSSVGQVINYTYTIRNNISSNIRAPYTVFDSLVTNENCTGATTPLSAGNQTTCSGSYTVTQADLDAGLALTSTISATAIKATNPGSGSTLTSNTVSFSVPVVQNPALNLTVSAAPNPATVNNTAATYTYTLTNNGNVTLSPAFTITDNKASGITCANPAVAIAPGGTKTCTGTRTITQPDLDDGSVISTASATAVLGSGTVSSSSVTTTVTTFVGARLTLSITANPNPGTGSGQIITYTYTLKNTGNVLLSSPYSVTSTRTGSADCSAAPATIPVGGSIACVGFYTTQPGDIGTSVSNSATATATDGASTVTSNNATLNVPVNP